MPHDDLSRAAREWMRFAEADLAYAGVPLPEHGLYEQLCFHAQQAAEKAIKAVLVSLGIDFPKSHNIEFLLTLLPVHVSRVAVLDQASQLTTFATFFRYPGDREDISFELYQEMFEIARETVAWAKAVIATVE
jgi:HEPN domain-containing protein